jgi:hypothetical protein
MEKNDHQILLDLLNIKNEEEKDENIDFETPNPLIKKETYN